MAEMEHAIEETLLDPVQVVQSLSDPEARLYYRFYFRTMVGSKYLCVVVNAREVDPFVLTAYLTRPRQERGEAVAKERKRVKIWYDAEGDYLEVIFDQRPGYFRETENDQVMEKVDQEGHVLGFSVLRVSNLKSHPLEIAL